MPRAMNTARTEASYLKLSTAWRKCSTHSFKLCLRTVSLCVARKAFLHCRATSGWTMEVSSRPSDRFKVLLTQQERMRQIRINIEASQPLILQTKHQHQFH